MHHLLLIILLFFPTLLFSQLPTGPGGVGNSSDNGLWLKADEIIGLSNNDPVVTWFDRSGNNNNAHNSSVNEQPVFQVSSSIGGRPSVVFDGVLDQMMIPNQPILNGSQGIFFYTVIRPTNLDTRPRAILGKRLNSTNTSDYGYIFSFFSTSNNVHLITNHHSNLLKTNGTYTPMTNYMLGFEQDRLRVGERMRIFNAGTVVSSGVGLDANLKNSSQDLVLGGHNKDYKETSSGPQLRLGADYAEVIQYNRALNSAERKIIENYLGAKYQITVANPYYNHIGYPGEVAGIGRDNINNLHSDAQGSSIVRINNPSSLDDGDYLMWGHNEVSSDLNDMLDVDGNLVEVRLSRVWAITETGDVGTVNVSFDISGFSPLTPSDLLLLIDRNKNGFQDNDVTPITGSLNGSVITFTGVNFENGDYFTLGSINFNQTPLPVELTDFTIVPEERYVNIIWSTATELNADYYLLSKSKDGKSFENFAKVTANGTTSSASHYKEMDNAPLSGTSYYRLAQVDFNGKTTYYAPLSINRNQEPYFLLVPNPTEGAFKLRSSIATEGKTTVSVYTSVGNKVNEIKLTPEEINVKLIDLGLSAGVYFLRISQENGSYTSLKLIMK